MSRGLTGLASCAMALAAATPAGAVPHTVSDLHEIVVHDGVNAVSRLTSDGREGLIVRGVRQYLTADGTHHVFLVLTRRKAEPRGWDVVPAGDGPSAGPDDQESLADTPHTGEDQVASLRFTRARVDGEPATLLIQAHRSMEGPIPAPSHVQIRLYRLAPDAEASGDRFVLLDTLTPSACYGNTDLALYREIGLPLPSGYQGPKSSGPCGVY